LRVVAVAMACARSLVEAQWSHPIQNCFSMRIAGREFEKQLGQMATQ
jgi:hypothetical protein